MDKRTINTEKRRLQALLERAEVPQLQRDVLQPVIDNMAWQRIKLNETMEEMQEASVVCEYDNGGGQTGTRENPIFKGYVNLWRAYMVGVEKFTSYLPKEMQEEAITQSVSILEQVKNMKKAN